MAKADIASAYRTVGVHPSHQHLLNFAWRDPATGVLRYYTDHRLPFGHAKAPELFCRISAAVRAMMAAMGYAATVVFVDDFFVIAADRPLCAAALAALAGLLAELGFEESLKKRLLPAQQQIFLGLLYDTASPGAYPVTVTGCRRRSCAKLRPLPPTWRPAKLYPCVLFSRPWVISIISAMLFGLRGRSRAASLLMQSGRLTACLWASAVSFL